MTFNELCKSHETIISAPPSPECFVSIIVPVRNEAAVLSGTLGGFTKQFCGKKSIDFNEFEILFLVNNSDDDSAEIIRRWQSENPHLRVHIAEKNFPPGQSNIGHIRRELMNEAFLRLSGNKYGGGIIATTDGDTIVANNWLAATVAEIGNGADAVGGRILIHSSELKNMDAKCRNFHLRDTGYRLMSAEIEACLDNLAHDSVPRHHQHFNGSFAVTTEAFAAAGGVPEVRFLEDVAFYHSLLRVDAKFRHSPRVRVYTSARSEGKTELGLSTQINEWTVMGKNGDEYFVESAHSIDRRLRTRKKLRRLWRNGNENKLFQIDEIKKLAADFFVSEEFIRLELSSPQTFGSLHEKILHEQNKIGEWAKENPLVGIERAIYDLRLMLEKMRGNISF